MERISQITSLVGETNLDYSHDYNPIARTLLMQWQWDKVNLNIN
jgi:hypothetical protein